MMVDRMCMNCRFWKPMGDDNGKCHRRAPLPYLMIDGRSEDSSEFVDWPLTFNNDWCGEWQAKPTPPAAAPPPATQGEGTP